MMSSPIRILLADDHAGVRKCVRELLEDEHDIQVVGEATDGQQAVDFALVLRPDVVLMDVHMPVLTGIEATRRIRADAPGVKVVVLTTYDDEVYISALRRAGADGYLLKTAERYEIVAAIRAAHSLRAAPDPPMLP